jgi:hypothetical protein
LLKTLLTPRLFDVSQNFLRADTLVALNDYLIPATGGELKIARPTGSGDLPAGPLPARLA